MGMRDWAVEDYGIVLKTDDLKRICMKLFDDFTEEAWEEDDCGFIDELTSKIDLCRCGEFTGEAIAIGRDGRDQYHDTVVFSGDSLYYIAIKKYPTLFEGAYACFDDMTADFKNALAESVPDDFNFSNVRHIIGTYYG